METSEIKYLKEHQDRTWEANSGISRQTLELHKKLNEKRMEAENETLERSKKKPGKTIAATFAKEFEERERNKTR